MPPIFPEHVWGERGRETEAIQKPKSVYHQNDKIQKETCIHMLCHTKIYQINLSSLDKIMKQCSSANKWWLEFDWHHWNVAKHSENIYILFCLQSINKIFLYVLPVHFKASKVWNEVALRWMGIKTNSFLHVLQTSLLYRCRTQVWKHFGC